MDALLTRSPASREQEDPLGLSPSVSSNISGIFCLSPRTMAVLFDLIKNKRYNKKNYKPSAVLQFLLFQTRPLFASLKLL
jgi:hypothetical protein